MTANVLNDIVSPVEGKSLPLTATNRKGFYFERDQVAEATCGTHEMRKANDAMQAGRVLLSLLLAPLALRISRIIRRTKNTNTIITPTGE